VYVVVSGGFVKLCGRFGARCCRFTSLGIFLVCFCRDSNLIYYSDSFQKLV